ncbi:hypothetical protein [Mycobacterium servetii]|uniref:Uncharacterized protein n=1 Tax=Mycobacterium servetii TaxID=3237418 RepID=A0ABV4C2Z3_9MYCO
MDLVNLCPATIEQDRAATESRPNRFGSNYDLRFASSPTRPIRIPTAERTRPPNEPVLL